MINVQICKNKYDKNEVEWAEPHGEGVNNVLQAFSQSRLSHIPLI